MLEELLGSSQQGFHLSAVTELLEIYFGIFTEWVFFPKLRMAFDVYNTTLQKNNRIA